MPKLQAAVPPGAPPGALLRVRLPDGNEVNVRVPKGLRPGDEFIFEVNPSGSGTTTTITEGIPKVGGHGSSSGGVGSHSKKSDKSHSNNKLVSKNPKKKARGTQHSDSSHHNYSGGGGGGGSGDSSNSYHAGGKGGAAPSFVTRFFNMYNQVYDILSQVNEGSISSSSPTSASTTLQRKSSSSSSSGSNSNQPLTTHQPLSLSPTDMQTSSDCVEEEDDALESTTLSTSTSPQCRLLDKDITSYEGLRIALLASTFIGFSIVVGFLGGVLYAAPSDDIIHQRW
jgi:hypothetical protein